MKRRTIALSIALSSLLAACNSDSTDTTTSTNNKPFIISGVFQDSAVEGLEYSTTSNPSAQYTKADGFYLYQVGDEITFKIGGVVLGKAIATAKLSPADLSSGFNDKALNIAQLLQTLDSDGDPSNGIKLEATQRDLLKSLTESSIKLAASGNDFGTELAKLGLKVRDRNLASEHFESTLASQFGKDNTSKIGDISLTKHQIVVDPKFNVAYPGTLAGLKATFPNGFPFSLGSALAFKGKTSDGAIEFYVLSDRGPNADSPTLADGTTTKVFPAPDFTPKFGVMRLKDGVASLISVTDILNADGSKTTGRPTAANEIGSSKEVPLSDTLQTLATDKNGIDPEGIVVDKNGDLWICDEYGPFLIRIDPKTGKILEKLYPGAGGLPAVLANRQPNRGFEGIAITPNGKIYGAIQSNLEITDSKNNKSSKALFTRITEYDPVSKATRMFAYPIDANYSKSKELKIGDLLAISDTRFLLIEQGIQKDGLMHRSIYLIDISSATDLSSKLLADKRELEFGSASDLAAVQMVKRSKLFDYDVASFGYLAEKSEGLTMIDGKTIAIVNDNDFDIKASLQDGKGKTATDCVISDGKLSGCKIDGVAAAADTVKFNISRGDPTQAPSRLWLFKLPKDIKEYSVN
ncbi:esterase-like activity of phytase family protein [Iodobacter sp. CM08]|uniref:esterase-like activity of phytase family protein n=1 Tax=Iodobacter sp. CM08 TaxID=3085902 RepID=UPI0029821D07|nr:esterase-like activity of phytase family protein [Iodobacter sp. CM08]MDW5416848.1 esterase-like activity of phytase family protein [Iodobacter sp. CM08]